ncbi:hypothetical protein [Alcanivorax sp.]|uniref:hypothetical protein n=1 Tax=Alcanivorax sp. TaxID=1872427 RepID=UPI000C0CBDFB|nr:hypothetical protein [Alcanivorax sp.]PHR65093.1 MAG: hypothetical protein COA55_12175 [Alcanivorax sp.]
MSASNHSKTGSKLYRLDVAGVFAVSRYVYADSETEALAKVQAAPKEWEQIESFVPGSLVYREASFVTAGSEEEEDLRSRKLRLMGKFRLELGDRCHD